MTSLLQNFGISDLELCGLMRPIKDEMVVEGRDNAWRNCKLKADDGVLLDHWLLRSGRTDLICEIDEYLGHTTMHLLDTSRFRRLAEEGQLLRERRIYAALL